MAAFTLIQMGAEQSHQSLF